MTTTTKYNRSEIMKAAWVIRRKQSKSMSASLKMAWEQIKKEAKKAELLSCEKAVKIQTGWHKAKEGATYKQIDYLRDLNVDMTMFNSTTNAMRSIDKDMASTAIDAAKRGLTVVFI